MIMILRVAAVITYGRHRDHGALCVVDAIVAHRTGDKPADTHVLLRADDEQPRSVGFGYQDGSGLAGREP